VLSDIALSGLKYGEVKLRSVPTGRHPSTMGEAHR
jgi:hypothetical protein